PPAAHDGVVDLDADAGANAFVGLDQQVVAGGGGQDANGHVDAVGGLGELDAAAEWTGLLVLEVQHEVLCGAQLQAAGGGGDLPDVGVAGLLERQQPVPQDPGVPVCGEQGSE